MSIFLARIGRVEVIQGAFEQNHTIPNRMRLVQLCPGDATTEVGSEMRTRGGTVRGCASGGQQSVAR
jgi:hypothetical protein